MSQHEYTNNGRSPKRNAPQHDAARSSAPLADHRTAPVQMVKVHHNPRKKKHLSKAVRNKQVEEAQEALRIKRESPVPISNAEALRLAREAIRAREHGEE